MSRHSYCCTRAYIDIDMTWANTGRRYTRSDEPRRVTTTPTDTRGLKIVGGDHAHTNHHLILPLLPLVADMADTLLRLVCEDGKLSCLLLDLGVLSIDPTDDEKEHYSILGVAIHTLHASETNDGDAAYGCINDKTRGKCVDWCVQQMKVALEEIDFMVKQARSAIKAAAADSNKDEEDIKIERIVDPTRTIQRCAHRYGCTRGITLAIMRAIMTSRC